MPGTKFGPKVGEDTATNAILRKLAILVPLYYLFYYIIALIVSAAFGTAIDGKEPFDFVAFNPGLGGRDAAVWTSYFLMLLVNAALVYFVGRSTKMSFDYVLTLAFIHFILSMLVMLSFPVNWVYWVTAILGNGGAAVIAELSCYYLRDMRSIKVEHE